MLTIVLGNRGSAKTLWMVIMALCHTGRKFFSNFKIDNWHYEHLGLEMLYDLPFGVEVFFDEFYALADSRISMSYVNRFASFVCFQLRKTDRNLFVSAQQFSTIDKRYREDYDYLLMCRRIPNEFDDRRLWDFSFTTYSKEFKTYETEYMSIENAIPFFDLYDTFEIIPPRNPSKLQYEVFKDESETLMKYARVYLQRVYPYFKENFLKYIKKKQDCKDYLKLSLMDNGISEDWTNSCYLALKPVLAAQSVYV